MKKDISAVCDFMQSRTRAQGRALKLELAGTPAPAVGDIRNVQLIPAFMLSQSHAALQICCLAFQPFLLIDLIDQGDLIVAFILMASGTMTMPPNTIALQLKILIFACIDGRSLLLKALVGACQ